LRQVLERQLVSPDAAPVELLHDAAPSGRVGWRILDRVGLTRSSSQRPDGIGSGYTPGKTPGLVKVNAGQPWSSPQSRHNRDLAPKGHGPHPWPLPDAFF